MQELRLDRVQDRISRSLYQGRRSWLIDELLRSGGEVYVVAGAVRDAIASEYEGQKQIEPRDIDIGVSGVSRDYLDDVLTDFGMRNRHGGFVLRESGLPTWDVWRFEDSIGLRKTGTKFSLRNVLRTFNLSCNGVALNLKTGIFTDAGAISSIRHRRLSFVQNPIHHSVDTFAAKAILTQLRFGFDLSVDLKLLISKHLVGGTLVYESKKVFPEFSLLNVHEGNSARWHHPQEAEIS
jgi:hypothetical protein